MKYPAKELLSLRTCVVVVVAARTSEWKERNHKKTKSMRRLLTSRSDEISPVLIRSSNQAGRKASRPMAPRATPQLYRHHLRLLFLLSCDNVCLSTRGLELSKVVQGRPISGQCGQVRCWVFSRRP